MIELSIEIGTRPAEALRTNRDDVLFGHASDCDLVLATSTVARRHGYLEQVQGVVFVVDNGAPRRMSLSSSASQLIVTRRERFEVGAVSTLTPECRIRLVSSDTEWVGPEGSHPVIAGSGAVREEQLVAGVDPAELRAPADLR